jgi:hypothetical protein
VESCLYQGFVRHRRRTPVRHAFRKRLFLVYLDLDELPEVFRGRWLWSTRRPAPVWLRRADYLDQPERPLAEVARERVAALTGHRPVGPVRLLTQLRTFGFVFNPLSLYFCFDASGRRLDAVLAEVSNTPWNERHYYALRPDAEAAGPVLRFDTPKEFHVSPFMGMRQTYRWTLRAPGERLVLGIESREDGRPLFDAALLLRRREIDGRQLAAALVCYPWQTAQVIAGIYWQAFRLRRKGAPVHPHPREAAALPPEVAR